MNRKYRILSLLLVFVLAFSLVGSALAVDEAGDIVILSTNDVHNGVDESIGYAGLAAYKAEMEAAVGEGNVTLVDAGDSIQGAAIGTLSKGSYLIDIMEYVGYDIAIPGNHEFDFGMDRFLELAKDAAFPYISCNFTDLKADKLVFDPYQMVTYGDIQVAYVSVTTPETFTKSTPAYFQDDSGNYIYGFCEGNDGKDLYAAVQSAIDAAETAGADYIVVVGHLGIDAESSPWTSKEVIANTTGIDVFIDGHSHSAINGEKVADKDGAEVVLVQTGTKLAAIGKVVIKADGTITGELVTEYAGKDADTDAYIKDIQAQFEDDLNQVVAKTDVELYVNDPADPETRIIRNRETNLGDLCADAYRTLLGADIAFVNGGGIRASISAGDITYGDIIAVHPFGNSACLIEATGQEILDALELSASAAPGELGGFLQVSGISYTIDTTVPSTVKLDDKGNFVEVTGERRVSDVKVGEEPIDPNATYTLASHNYMLKSGGDGYAMFVGNTVLQDEVLIDNQVLINYIVDELGGVVGEAYAEPYGQGRISIVLPAEPFTDVAASNWYYDAVVYVYEKGLMNGVAADTFAPSTAMTRGMMVTMLYNLEGKPAVETKASEIFTDVADDAWYADAVVWASENKIVSGMGDGLFAPTTNLTREQMAAMIYNWADYKLITPVGDWMIQLDYTDADTIAAWAADAVAYCKLAGIMEGADGAFSPKGEANRAMGATLLMRLDQMDKTPIERPVGEYAVTEISKYGNITLDMPCADFLAKGYAYGDTVTVTFGRTALTVPFVSNYSDVDNGSAAVLCRDGDEFVTIAINMGNFAGTYGLEVDDTLDIALAEAGAYKDEYLIRQLTRTDVREDYASDEVFANFRAVTVGGIAEGTLYRSSSPVNPEIGRSTYADALAEAAGIKTFLNLADSAEVLTAYEGFADSYYKTVYDAGGVIALNMGVDFSAPEFREKLAEGLRFLAKAEGPVLIHCNEGKDRAGFVVALLECLMGADVDEIVSDYMRSYINYYGVEAGSEQYEAIANSNIRATLATLAGLEKGADLSGVDFAAAAETYLKDIGLTDAEIDAIQALFAPAADVPAAA